MAIQVAAHGTGGRFAVKVVPGASRDRLMGELGGALKVAVSAPPEGGKANAAVVALLAGALGVPAGSVTILRGHTSPRKEVAVAGLAAEEISARLSALT
jgi:uncharacterized protein YggU (UPF0235/DUF167 family)